MAQPLDAVAQSSFAAAICAQLRAARRRQGLTQAEVAQRTGGLVSKAALANYETGHRSLRIDIFWVLARALGEEGGALISAAERSAGYRGDPEGPTPISVNVDDVLATTDERLAAVRRWFSIRHPSGLPKAAVETLDDGAVRALSSLMGIAPVECRRLLLSLAGTAERERVSVDIRSGHDRTGLLHRGGASLPHPRLGGPSGIAALTDPNSV